MVDRVKIKTWVKINSEKPNANVTCPDCGRRAHLEQHEIKDNGDVFPSLVCPHEGCGFHEYVNLDGWPDGH